MATGTFPGMVTPQVTGSTYQNMTPQAEAYYYKELDRKREEREQRNAEIRAQQAQQAQAAQNAANQARVREAFNQTYGPQLQRAYQDTAVQSATANSPAGRARDWAIGHGFSSGGTIGQPGTDITAYAAPRLQQPTMSQAQLQNTLDTMWRGQTDPYTRTANSVMGNLMKMFHPSDEPAKEWGRSKGMEVSRKSSGGGKGKTTPAAGSWAPLPTVDEWKEKYY